MIEVPGQPLAERILRAALADEHPPQQLLFHGPAGTGKRAAARETAWEMMDPAGRHERTGTALDLSEVRAAGATILLADLDAAVAQINYHPSVMERRVLIIEGAERLRAHEGAARVLKVLEEPPPLSHMILITDHPAELLDTIRSRCLPVPFRGLGWTASRQKMEPFETEMRQIGIDLALEALAGTADGTPARRVAAIQARMEEVAGRNESEQLAALRREAAALEGKRGERTAQKRAEDHEKRERRRLVTDGWAFVLDSGAAACADALAVAVGAEGAVRHTDRLEELRAVGTPERRPFLERAVEEFQLSRAELDLNPRVELAAEALLVHLDEARHGAHRRLVAHGRVSM